jgi:3'-phosphoadenosine 5'-phosphosulfate sulfotransferase (PAPS reductase)/FAD synthetase
VFVDTGLEYPELREFVKTIDNVTWLKPNINFKQVIEKFGYPVISKKIAGYIASAKRNPDCMRAKYIRGEVPNTIFGGGGKYAYLIDSPFKISEDCCRKLKKEPNQKYAKETGRKPIFGTMASESVNRKQKWKDNGCNVYSKNEQYSQPLSFWTEQDILEYLSTFKIPYASVYGEIQKDSSEQYCTTGCNRTGCIFCAFGAHLEKEPNRFQQLKETHPKLWNYCMKPTSEGGLGMKEVLEYIGVKTGHEDEIDISKETGLTSE